MVSRVAARATRMVPGLPELGPMVLAGLWAFAWLVVLRHAVAAAADADFTPAERWKVHLGELQFWCGWVLASAVLVRWTPAGLRRGVQALYHLLTAVALMLSGLELLFFAVTGARADFEVIGFFIEDASSVLMLLGAEAKPVHAWAALGMALGCLAPFAWRPRSEAWPWRLGVLALAWPLLWWGTQGRPSLLRPLRELVPSLAETLWFDGLERLGEERLPPAPAEVQPRRIATRPAGRPPHVVVVVLESVGARGTSLFVPELQNTPVLEKMASEGLWADQAYAVVPHTSKALVSILCGDWPFLMRTIREARPGGLPNRCLPELLEDLGYRTAFFQPAVEDYEDRVDLVHHLGFDRFRARDSLDGTRMTEVNYFGWEDRAMLAPGMRWAVAAPDQPHLSVFLTLVSHHDYRVPPSFPRRPYPGQPGRRDDWLNAIRYGDAFLGELVDRYREAGLLENTVFVVLGDHGEAFGEHGLSLHDMVMYEEGLHVPLVIWGPPLGGRTGRIEGLRQNVDVLPTVLELVGATISGPPTAGYSLLGPVPPDRVLYHSSWRSYRAMARRQGVHKLIERFHDGPPLVFDLVADPEERRSVASVPGEATVAAWGEDLRRWRSKVNGRYDEARARWIAENQRPDDRPARATWDGKLDLVDCRALTPRVVAGESAWVRCDWRPRGSLRSSWRLQVRLTGAFGARETTWLPRAGDWPTWKWPARWSVTDDFRIQVPRGAKSGPATVAVRWERGGLPLTTSGGDGWEDVAAIEVVPKF